MCLEKRLYQEKGAKRILFSLSHVSGNTTAAHLIDEGPLVSEENLSKWTSKWVHSPALKRTLQPT